MLVNVTVTDASGQCWTETVNATEPVSIGRDTDCGVCLPDQHVSRTHAILNCRAETLEVQDTSSNGTLVDNQLICGEALEVAYGTPILLGEQTLYVEPFTSSSTVPKTDARESKPRTFQSCPSDCEISDASVSGDLRREIHQLLISRLDPAALDAKHIDDVALRPKVLTALRRIVESMSSRLPVGISREELIAELADEALGLGPLERLLSDPTISEIMVVDAHTIYIERNGRLERTQVRFTDDDRVRAVIERIVTPLGRRIDESSPLVDARLGDGSRVNAIIRPLAIKGSCITIRKFSREPLQLADLVNYQTLSPSMGTFLTRSVMARRNILVSGGTGSGKTTLLNVLSAAIPDNERIVTIEDAAELRLTQPHVVSLETKQANLEGTGSYSVRDLVRNALRMRPDRIVVGEVRGGEALDMLQAMNTGHDGSLTTTHANSPREALARLETLALMAGLDLPSRAIREQIAASIQLVVQQARLSDGSRKVLAVSELCGLDPQGEFDLRCIYRFTQTNTKQDACVEGHFSATGYLPTYLPDLMVKGLIAKGEAYL